MCNATCTISNCQCLAESFHYLFLNKSKNLYDRLIQLFYQNNDEKDLEKFQLEQINSVENVPNEHDETIQRFQQIAQELSSPIVSNIDCSNNSTPPIRRHHQRILQQNDLEPLSRTPITPAHTNSSNGKILHSTINGSYTGPMTRNRKKNRWFKFYDNITVKKQTTDRINFSCV